MPRAAIASARVDLGVAEAGKLERDHAPVPR